MTIGPISDQPPSPTRKRGAEEPSDTNKRVTRSANKLREEASIPQVPTNKKITRPSTGNINPKTQRVAQAGVEPRRPVASQRTAELTAHEEPLRKRKSEGKIPEPKQRSSRGTYAPKNKSEMTSRGNEIVNVNVEDKSKSTLLINAVTNGNTKEIENLCKGGANVNAVNEDGSTPLMCAAIEGHCEAIETLCKYGANVNAALKYSRITPLMYAAAMGNCEAIEILCKYGANVNAVMEDGSTPLMCAAREGHCEAIKTLFKHGADVNEVKMTLLMRRAAQTGNCEVIKTLCEHGGANVDAVGSGGMTLLMSAAQTGNCEVIKTLCEHGANVNAVNNNGVTPLLIAAEGGHCEAIKTLLDLNADPTKTDKNGYTIFSLLTMTHPPNWKRTKATIKAHQTYKNTMQDYTKQFTQTKLLSHAFELNGVSRIQGQFINLAGSTSILSANAMAKSVIRFAKEYPDILDAESGQSLADTLLTLVDSPNHMPEIYLQRILSGLPTFIPTGFKGHAAVVFIWNDLFIHCDRMLCDETEPLMIRRYNRTTLNAKTIKEILDLKSKTEDDYLDYIAELPKTLHFKSSSPNERTLEEIAALPHQNVANCSWASLEGVIKAYLLLNKYSNLSDTPDDVGSLQVPVDFAYNKWHLFQQIELLEKYLTHDYSLSESKDVKANELDAAHLVLECFKAIWASNCNKPPLIDEKMQQRIDNLEKRYLGLVPDTVKSNFHHQKRLIVTDTIFTTRIVK